MSKAWAPPYKWNLDERRDVTVSLTFVSLVLLPALKTLWSHRAVATKCVENVPFLVVLFLSGLEWQMTVQDGWQLWISIYLFPQSCPQNLDPFLKAGWGHKCDNLLRVGDTAEKMGIWSWLSLHSFNIPDNNLFYLTFRQQICSVRMECCDGFPLILLLLEPCFSPTDDTDYLFLGDFVNLHLTGLAAY